VARLIALWQEGTGRDEASLLTALESGSGSLERLRALVATAPDAPVLLRRLDQFAAESDEIVPAVVKHLAAGDVPGIGPWVERSQQLAEDTLTNQIPETITLVRSARRLGAAAASAFGAGFGGAVWALVPRGELPDFLERWGREYRGSHPASAATAEFFGTDPGPAATEL
jgi:galactokinase